MLKNISKVMIDSAGVLAVVVLLASQTFAGHSVLAETTAFQVNVKEGLSVSVSTPDSSSWASGNAGDFLRNKVSVSITSNNAQGFKASMYSEDTTNLTNASNSSVVIPTLSSSTTRSAFPANKWGYSLNDTAAGSGSSNYNAMSTSAITLITASAGTYSGSQDIYFGAKADMSQAAGTYTGTVIISVVTGTINENTGNDNSNPTTPTNPATPDNSGTPTYNSITGGTDNTPTGVGVSTIDGTLPGSGGTRYSGTTTYTSVSTSDSVTTTTTQITGGDNTDAYSSPQGVMNSNISSGTNLSTALATTAVVAAASGAFFFIAAKRRDDDDDDEEEEL